MSRTADAPGAVMDDELGPLLDRLLDQDGDTGLAVETVLSDLLADYRLGHAEACQGRPPLKAPQLQALQQLFRRLSGAISTDEKGSVAAAVLSRIVPSSGLRAVIGYVVGRHLVAPLTDGDAEILRRTVGVVDAACRCLEAGRPEGLQWMVQAGACTMALACMRSSLLRLDGFSSRGGGPGSRKQRLAACSTLPHTVKRVLPWWEATPDPCYPRERLPLCFAFHTSQSPSAATRG